MTEKDILSKVIGVEKEIQERLMAEKEKSVEWLEQVRKESEESVSRERDALRESFESAKVHSRADAEKRAAEIIGKAKEEAERISQIGDETLRRVLLRHISAILPQDGSSEKAGLISERAHDRQDVKD